VLYVLPFFQGQRFENIGKFLMKQCELVCKLAFDWSANVGTTAFKQNGIRQNALMQFMYSSVLFLLDVV